MLCNSCGNPIPDESKFCVMCGSPAVAETPRPVQEAPAKPDGRKKKTLLALALAILVVAVVSAAIFLIPMFSKQTVYLLTETKTETGERYMITQTYTYDENGNPVENCRTNGFDSNTSESKLKYEYDETGRLQSARLTFEGVSGKFKYAYDKNGHLESITMKMMGEEVEAEVDCDGDGNVEELVAADENGETMWRVICKFHKDGWLKETTQEIQGRLTHIKFDANGKQVEYKVETDRQLLIHYTYEYDDRGNMTQQDILLPDGSQQRIQVEYTYDKDGKVEAFVYTVNDQTIRGERKKTGRKTVFELSGEESAEDGTVELKYDGHGNLLEMVITSDGEQQQRVTYQYTEVKVSRDYKKPNWNEAQWLLWLPVG